MESFGNADGVKKAMDYFRSEVKKAGFPDLHLQLIGDGSPTDKFIELVVKAEVNSVTKYNWGWPYEEDYLAWGTKAMQRRDQWTAKLDSLGVPFFPNASIGWDDTRVSRIKQPKKWFITMTRQKVLQLSCRRRKNM